MPTLPRPFTRRSAPPAVTIPATRDRAPLPKARPVTPAAPKGAASVATNSVAVETPKPRRTIADRLFPVRPGMPEPAWSRVVGLIIFMALVWEVFSYVYTYFFGINVFGGRMTAHDATVAWQASIQTLPWAILLSTLGSVPGFWLMRARVRQANKVAAQEKAAQRALANPGAGQGNSARARRRRDGKRTSRR